jgi:putative colanic acid biosynthesis glycosyltransferase
MFRVLQINVTLNTGSTGRIAEAIGLKIIQSGGESTIAYGREMRSSVSKVVKIGNIFDQVFHLVWTRLFDLHALGFSAGTKKLIKQIKAIDPDVIHLHNLHGYYINIKALFEFLKSFGKPIVWTLHDCWSFTGHCAYFDHVDCQKWKTGCYKCPLTKSYPASYLIDNSKLNFELKKKLFNSIYDLSVVTVSNWLMSKVDQSFLKYKREMVIYNGIDLSLFKPDASDNKVLNIDRPYILSVANIWDSRKGLNDLIKLRILLDLKINMVIVGLNDSQIEQLPQGVIGLPKTKDLNELVALYSGAKAFINPSATETFGMVTAEAMACGTPVVVYNATASPELVGEGTGYVVEKGNIDALYKAVSRILLDGKEKYSASCRRYAEIHFDQDKQYSMYISLYQKLIQKKGIHEK